MPDKTRLSRRQFVTIAAIAGAAGPGLLVGCSLAPEAAAPPGRTQPATLLPSAPPSPAALPSAPFAPNIWLRVDPDNSVTIWVAKSEMGQGVLTALPMLVAEELEADWASIRIEQARLDPQYGAQVTWGSSSVRDAYRPLREAGATARELLIAAGAQVWQVDKATCRAERGAVIHDASGRRLTYGVLAGTAASLKQLAPGAIHLKDPRDFRIIGTPLPRLDTPAKVDGSATFGLDVRRPGMLYAVVAHCPVCGGKVARFDATQAKAVPGVRDVVQIDSDVAVVADTTWAALQGRAALVATWDEGPNAGLSSAEIRQQFEAQAQKLEADSGVAAALTSAAKRLDAVYETAYLAHATMEPMNCTADVRSDRCEIWVPTQDPDRVRSTAAALAGIPADAVVVHVTLMGGGFGRRVWTDFVAPAVKVSKAMRAPVQLVWSREDDMQRDFYRPASYHRLSAGLDAQGKVLAWEHLLASHYIGNPLTAGVELPYAIPNKHAKGASVNVSVSVNIWRAVEYSYGVFVTESFFDEVAAARGADPYELRRELLSAEPRLKAVLELAATKAGWGTPLPPGRGRGIAACAYQFSNTYVAEVAEVTVTLDDTIRVDRVVCAIDCGTVINPNIVTAQMEGAIIDGLTAALKAEITFERGQVQQRNFDTYPLLRMKETPAIEVYIVPSTEAPSGVGEPGLPPIAPAVANAVFAATGKRLRRLPMRVEHLRQV